MTDLDPAINDDDDYYSDYDAADDGPRGAGVVPEAPAEVAPTLRFKSVYEFVDEHLSDMYRRDVSNASQLQWCPDWWAHGEAVSRLEALWRTWEHLRLDGATGMATWWKDYADPTMAVLFDPHGTFAGCSPERGHQPRLKPLPCNPMPLELLAWAMSEPDLRDAKPTTTDTERN